VISAPPRPAAAVSLVFASAALLIAAMLTVSPTALPTSVQIVGLLIVVVILGVPHGALDPWIAEVAGLIPSNPGRVNLNRVIFNLVYTALAGAVVAIWSAVPTVSLAGFLVISAWHFSGDWADGFGVAMRWVSGSLLLLLPIGFHTAEVAEIFTLLSGDRGADLAERLSLPLTVLVVTAVGVMAVAIRRRKWWAVLELGALLALAASAPPLVYFAVYFCLLHSPSHLIGYFRLAGASRRGRLTRMTLIYSIGSLAIAIPVVYVWSDVGTDSLLLRLVFVGLAALTVPHMALLEIAARRHGNAKISIPDAVRP
jgi:beta-carotene 15,15'-dioxygenase